MMDRHREAYREEAADLLRELEASLLELEASADSPELVGRVFRALHTIKGSGAMFGFDAIAQFTHEVETAYDGVREGRVAVTPELVGVSLAARDHIQSLLQESGEPTALQSAGAEILERLRSAVPMAGAAAAGSGPVEKTSAGTAAGPPATWRIRFDPAAEILLNGTNPVLLFRELETLGELSLMAHLDRIPELDEIDPEQCYTHWDAMLTTSAGEDAIRDVFIFVEDRAVVKVQRVASDERRRVGEVLADRGDAAPGEIERILGQRPRAGDTLVQAGVVPRDRVEGALLEQRHLESARDKRQQVLSDAVLKVPAERVDNLVNIVGELVTVQARLNGYALAAGESEIQFIAEEVQRLTEQLRETAMGIRMLPIGDTFSRFKRLVRDLSRELGKKVELVTEGNETELDKTVIDQLSDPLVHLIRNAIDHGIEAPEARLAARKPAAGTIRLSAEHSGAHVVIRVADDGKGLDREAIRRRAAERGLISAGAVLSDQQTDALILAPGFSTSRQVTEISGRGVGMEVVQRSLESLHGTLAISSEPGRGTAITLRIPLTLAIIEGLLVEAGGAHYVAPLSNVLECIEIRRGAGGRSAVVEVRGELTPYIVLRERFRSPGCPPEIEQAILADTREGKFGFVVDRVIGDHHTVIKKLGDLCRGADEFSGATILGDGSLALILDFDKLAAGAIHERAAVN
jgi:two-component system, chemotaxis family, sensor kinase CheA